MMAVFQNPMSCLSRQKKHAQIKNDLALMTRYYNGQKCCWARRLTRFWDAADVQRLSQKDSFSPYIIASPVSCRKRTLLCLKSHIVRMVSVKSKINVSKFTLSCLWLSSASFSVASSSMPPSSALIRQHWLKMNIKIGKSELCPGACNVHGFGAATASMVQDACDGLAGSLTHSLTHSLPLLSCVRYMRAAADRSSSS